MVFLLLDGILAKCGLRKINNKNKIKVKKEKREVSYTVHISPSTSCAKFQGVFSTFFYANRPACALQEMKQLYYTGLQEYTGLQSRPPVDS